MAKTYKIIYSQRSKDSLRRIYKLHLRLVGKNSAQKIVSDIKKSIGYLSDFPFISSEPRDERLKELGLRLKICGNYVCVYSVNDNIVEVENIVDGRTDYIKRLLRDR
ncbi:MAG: type II toxin-antitoxin system RelE/ParE family toxin [Ruminiclostridium sp.]|nr:type II toxin-antitoxin system RelE/ParE family toxin [Ruminiclostridium sp.]